VGRQQFTGLSILTQLYRYPEQIEYTKASPVTDTRYTVLDDDEAGRLDFLWVYQYNESADTIIITVYISTEQGEDSVNVTLDSGSGKWVVLNEIGLTSTSSREPLELFDGVDYRQCKVEVEVASPYSTDSLTVRLLRRKLYN